MFGSNISSVPINESGMLQTTQHDDAIGGSVITVYFGRQPPHHSAMPSLQTLQEIEVPHATKG